MLRIALCLVLLTASTLLAQSNVASLTGVVTDPAGAVVPNALITITNLDTGIATRTQSNSSGVYVAPSLISGRYQIQVEVAGFRKQTVPDLVLETGQRARLDVSLQVGEVTESVEVSASVTPLQLETAEVSDVVTSKEIVNIPLNGRSPYSLLALSAGMTTAGGDPSNLDYADSLSVNGSRRRGNAFVIDGASTTHIGGIAERIGSIESIQEFKVLASTYSAEYGRTAGGVITFQVKSGTSQFHGSLYEFHRNSFFSAKDWQNNARGIDQAQLIRNEFGGSLGGPVPFFNKRLFFFTSYEGIRDSIPLVKTRTIPDPALRTGNFSSVPVTVFDPLTGQPFPGNIIPRERLDPAALKFLELFPAPNNAGTFNSRFGISTGNWVRPQGRSDNKNYGTMRLDYNVTDQDKFFFTYSHVNEGPRDLVRDFENQLNTEIGPRFRNIKRGTLGYTRIFTPSLVNESLVSFQRDPRVIEPWYPEYDAKAELGIQRTIGTNMPRVSLSGGYGTFGDARFQDWVHQPATFSNIMTYLRGRHTMKFGGQLYQNQFWYAAANHISGTYNFNGEITGNGVAGRNNPINALADLLLGGVKTADYPVPQIPVNRVNYNLGLFFQDDWKVTNRLTLNLGLRYEFETKQIVKNNVYSRVDRDTGQLLVAGQNASRNLNLNNDWVNFSPRLGLAYSLNDRTVIRTGFAVFHSNFWLDNGEIVTYPGFTSSRAFVDQGVGRAQPFRYSEGFPVGDIAPVTDPLTEFAKATPAAPLPVPAVSYTPNDKLPYSFQWNLGVQRDLGWNTVVDVSYVGSRGVYLARTVAANNPGLERATDVVINRVPIQQVRPFPNLGAFNAVNYDATSIYNSLQTKATRRFSSGFSLDVNYTFSKNIDTSSHLEDSFQIPWQYANIERALSSLDRPHVFTMGWVYELPFGRGKPLLANNAVLSALIGGWQLNGLVSASSGPLSTITQTNTNLILANQRPDVIDPSNLGGHVDEPTFEGPARRWLIAPSDPAFPFRPSCSTCIGNLGRNTSRDPGFQNWNLGLFRMIPLWERARLELRLEAYNALNHVNFHGPASTNIDSADFGLITTAAPARQLQIGARIAW
jgi:hypothetical protein